MATRVIALNGAEFTTNRPDAVRHGMRRADDTAPEYSAWHGMRQRCENPNATSYEHYGGRGIRLCEEWRRSFEAFFECVGPRPSARHSLDRIDVDGHYEPGNVRWATIEEQNRNKRSTMRENVSGEALTLTEAASRYGVNKATLSGRRRRGLSLAEGVALPTETPTVTIGGQTKTVREFSEESGLSIATIHHRIARGWGAEELLSTPQASGARRGSKRYAYRGQELSLHQLSKLSGLSRSAIQKRLNKGWSVERAVETPPDPKKRTNCT